MSYRPGPVEAVGAVDAQTAPTAPWKTLRVFHELPQAAAITRSPTKNPEEPHYETQPLPLWTGWHVHQLPAWIHRLSAGGMFVVELLLPWVIFVPARLHRIRLVACAGLVLLQVVIGVTGNYGFFSLLTVALCLTLVDDCAWVQVLPSRLAAQTRTAAPDQPPTRDESLAPGPGLLGRGRRRGLAAVGAVALLALGGLTFAREIATTVDRSGRPSFDLSWSDPVVGWVQPFRSVNGYGLFRVMTVERPEIVIQGSADGLRWTEWDLRWKPGNLHRRPGLAAPHQPRLDWQLWFAALDPRGASYWLSPLMTRLLEGAPAVTALVGDAAFADRPPRYLRLAYYDYRFTTRAERAETGNWWHRELIDYLTEPVSLADIR